MKNKMKSKMKNKPKGFTLIEMSIVLIVIGIILAAVSVGKDLQRNAEYQKLSQSFVQGWALAYQNHFARVNLVIADDPNGPTLQVNQNNGEVCGAALHTAMDTAGVRMPAGRAEGSEDRYVYLDSNGNPQQIDICFDNIPWSVDDVNPDTYMLRDKNVMVIKGITPDLARLLDNSVDGIGDARFGFFREEQYAATIANGISQVWSKTNIQNFADNPVNQDESQVAILTAYYLMPE
ncbi:MAG: prepilin-type N-terminal cleavage/methylation domain-containing protein [Proteobacteria bacterium]|nr:prepilin-type N-terminal cleavage/methylation domain-containing protein [Pseudomonadota bacterium]